MNGITELAMLLKARENGAGYSPLLGRIESVAPLRVAVGGKIKLGAAHVKRLCEIDQTDEQGRHINLNREAVLLPYAGGQRFILLGVVI
jgi:hypothetical protein